MDGEPGCIVAVTIYAPDRDTGTDWRFEFRAQGALDTRTPLTGTDASKH